MTIIRKLPKNQEHLLASDANPLKIIPKASTRPPKAKPSGFIERVDALVARKLA